MDISIIGFVATVVSIVVGTLLWQKQGFTEEQGRKIIALEREVKTLEDKVDGLQKRISTLSQFCATVSTTESRWHNVILIGPRDSGKSSIASLWCKVDKLIASISPTPSFDTYDYGGLGNEDEKFFDDEIKVERIKKIKTGVRFFDYAGEDAQIPDAIRKIATSPDCTIIMVFNSDPGFANDNRRYFSRSLVEKINNGFNKSGFQSSSVKTVYIVFNKIDLFAGSVSDFDENLKSIKSIHIDNITNIESIFGADVKCIATSALTNHNIINLLQEVVRGYGR